WGQQRPAAPADTAVVGPEMGAPQEAGPTPGMWEWFSPSRGRTVVSQAGTRPQPDPPDDWVLLTDVEPDSRPQERLRLHLLLRGLRRLEADLAVGPVAHPLRARVAAPAQRDPRLPARAHLRSRRVLQLHA